MSINPDIQTRIQQLPAKQQKHFHQLIKDGESDPQRAAARLRQDLFDSKVDADFLITSQLAVAALNDPKTESHFPTEAEARQSYRNKISELRELDEDSPAADHLQGVLDRLSSRDEAAQARVEAFKGVAEQLRVKADEEKLANYQKAYQKEKTARIAELTKFGTMDAEKAEQQFMDIEHPRISASLMRYHGIG
jgi:hypothetical protein